LPPATPAEESGEGGCLDEKSLEEFMEEGVEDEKSPKNLVEKGDGSAHGDESWQQPCLDLAWKSSKKVPPRKTNTSAA
jgi:hypothetical protein